MVVVDSYESIKLRINLFICGTGDDHELSCLKYGTVLANGLSIDETLHSYANVEPMLAVYLWRCALNPVEFSRISHKSWVISKA